MAYEEFFTDGDKPYSENLNDSLVLTDAFDLSVPLCMPDGFSNGEFSSTLNVTRKCNVGLVTLKSVDNGVTIGTDSINGTGSVVFRIYPNFNCFYKWDKILLEKSGTVDISFRKPDGSGITATVGSDGTISDSSALKQLVEVDLVLTLSDASISQICVWFVNNHSKSVRTGALLEASQLVNVNGTVSANDDKAVNGGTVKTALDNLHTTVTGEIEDLSDNINTEITNLSSDVQTRYEQLLSLMPCMILTVTGSSFNEYNNNTAINGSNIIVDYGDGTIEPLGNRLNHSYTDGVNNHTIKVYGVTSLGENCFRDCSGLTSVVLPNGVTSLEFASFYSCRSLTSINIPSTVTSIGLGCFRTGATLTQIYLNWSNPSEIITYDSSWTTENSSNLKYYIPTGTTSAYTSKGYPSDKLVER